MPFYGIYITTDWQPPAGAPANILANMLADHAAGRLGYVQGASLQAVWKDVELTQGVYSWDGPGQDLDADFETIASTLGKYIHITWGVTSRVQSAPPWLQPLIPLDETYVKQGQNRPYTLLVESFIDSEGQQKIRLTAQQPHFLKRDQGEVVEVIDPTHASYHGRVLIETVNTNNEVKITQATGSLQIAFAGGLPVTLPSKSWSQGEWSLLPWAPSYLDPLKLFMAAVAQHFLPLYQDRIAIVTAAGISGSAEMNIGPGPLAGIRNAGFTDDQTYALILGAWVDMVQLLRAAFPKAVISSVPGAIRLADGRDVCAEIIAQLVAAHGMKYVVAHSGFSASKSGYIDAMQAQYLEQALTMGLTEEPATCAFDYLPPGPPAPPPYCDQPDPLSPLVAARDSNAVPLRYRVVRAHGDALGLNSQRGRLPDGHGTYEALVAFWTALSDDRRALPYP